MANDNNWFGYDMFSSAVNSFENIWNDLEDEDEESLMEDYFLGGNEYAATKLQRDWSLQDTADQRAYAEELYNKYQSPEALRQQYEDAGYSAYAALGQAANISPVATSNNSSTAMLAQMKAANAAQKSASAAARNAQTNSTNGIVSAMQSSINQTMDIQMKKAQIDNLNSNTETNNINNGLLSEETEIKQKVLNMTCTPDDYPNLEGFDDKWWHDMSVRLGHPVTFGDMQAMGIYKYFVAQTNNESHFDTHWQSHAESQYFRDNGDTGMTQNIDGYEVTSTDSSAHYHNMQELGKAVLDDAAKKGFDSKIAELQAKFDELTNESAIDATNATNRKTKHLDDLENDFGTFDKWKNECMDIIETVVSILNPLSRLMSRPSSRNNYKSHTRQRERYDSDGIMIGTDITTDTYER